jgi:hypothetical protein
VIILLLAIMVVVYLLLARGKESGPPVTDASGAPATVQALGTTRPEYNPFHHARGGDWVMRDLTPVLKTDKYVSSRTELEQYLVREVPAGSVLRITVDHGRWKEVLLVGVDGTASAVTGWVDSEKSHGTPAE